MKEHSHLRIWKSSVQKLKEIREKTGQSMVFVVDRLAQQELDKLQTGPKETKAIEKKTEEVPKQSTPNKRLGAGEFPSFIKVERTDIKAEMAKEETAHKLTKDEKDEKKIRIMRKVWSSEDNGEEADSRKPFKKELEDLGIRFTIGSEDNWDIFPEDLGLRVNTDSWKEYSNLFSRRYSK